MAAKKNVLYRPSNDPVPDISIGELLYNGLLENRNEILLTDVTTGESMLNGEMLEMSVSLARAMKKRGVVFGDRVAISSENSCRWIAAFCAAIYLGAIPAPINPAYTADEVKHTLGISKPRLIFASRRTEKLIGSVLPSLSWTTELIELDDAALSPSVPTLKTLVKEAGPVMDPRRDVIAPVPRKDEHAMAIFCSSGTTGLPKGVALSHKNYMIALRDISHPEYFNIRKGDVLLSTLPFFHGYGAAVMMLMIVRGGRAIFLQTFDLDLYIESVRKYQVTHLPIVPPILVLLEKHPRATREIFVSVREIVCGAAPISKDVHGRVKKKLGFKHIRNAYGMTELSIITTMTRRNETDLLTVGHVLSDTEVKVVNPETGETLGAHQVGEICTRGPRVMLGYYGNPQATAETIDPDGWLHSGDLGYYDETERIFVIDRFKELIKYKGYQVAPAELENVLLGHPAVKDAAAVGKPDEMAGELPMAFVVRQPGAKVTSEELESLVKEKLSPQKWLRGGVRFVEAIPKNPAGKILRRELKKMIPKL